ncbi:S41 family peptidase [Candidatus Kinetoplastidibacterium blastocrithidiae]|uniref:S41 family peptidase n=1 Tax=Candidatus Kinetoplastidibacterium blastocrithidiae TaxID=233181 RepID=UPI0002A66940|nr:S41 family peptidase [Candidatus Kinetoplastibacterium blastocrithidii]AFZ83238.1 carboxy-terminal processing protease [Candidatus Kinetoplastibacterium blastocrithidii (ex Strigomonas culicis)]
MNTRNSFFINNNSSISLKELKKIIRVFTIVKENYVKEVDSDSIVNNAISGMLSRLDPHSSYLDAEDYNDIKAVIHGEFGGLGMEVSIEDNKGIRVVSTLKSTPAADAGIISGDYIVKINDILTRGISLSKVINMTRGEPKSSVTLTILRGDDHITLEVIRDTMKINSVNCKLTNENILYIGITQFQENTLSDMVRSLQNIVDNDTQLYGIILDLRNNPGGLLSSAIGISGAFLPKGSLVVSTVGRSIEHDRKYFSIPEEYSIDGSDDLKLLPTWFKNIKMVVLVNSVSASASEIVAGAMQDHSRAKILGNKTFGKGSVQTIIPLDESSAVKLTTSLYFTPSGRSIQATGIIPDYIISNAHSDNLVSAQILRESDLYNHIKNDNKTNYEDYKELFDDRYICSNTIDAKFELEGLNDFQLREAISIVLDENYCL